jgi:serpin B
MAEAASTATGFEHFGLKLYSTVSQNKNGENVFLSPASIALAMSMCTVGARENTLKQMLNALEASSNEELIKTAEQVMQIFSIADQDKQIQLKLANRLYAQKAYELRQEYLKLVQSSFQADIKLEDFIKESAKVLQTINSWVEDRTNKLIRNLLLPEDVTPNTRLILVNCIYFKVNINFNRKKNKKFFLFIHQILGYMDKTI